MKSQAFSFNRERMLQIQEDNKKTNDEIDNALKQLNIDLDQDLVRTEHNQDTKRVKEEISVSQSEDSDFFNDLTDNQIEELYNKYKEKPKKRQQRLNYQYINPPTSNYKFSKQKIAKSTVSSQQKI
jgi:hypothetical protein